MGVVLCLKYSMNFAQQSQLILKLHDEWCRTNGYPIKKNKRTPTNHWAAVSTRKFKDEIIKGCK